MVVGFRTRFDSYISLAAKLEACTLHILYSITDIMDIFHHYIRVGVLGTISSEIPPNSKNTSRLAGPQ